MNDVVQIISSVGFPIVAALACGWFCKWLVSTYTDLVTSTMNKLSASIDELNEKIEKMMEDRR